MTYSAAPYAPVASNLHPFMASLRALAALCRPHQWTKQVVIVAVPALLGVNFVTFGPSLLVTVIAFCLAASAVYIFNDVLDIERDRLHPTKRARPLPSGDIAPSKAIVLAIALVTASSCLAIWVNPWVLVCLIAYELINVYYCMKLKHVPILDVLVVTSGFVLRAAAGAVAADIVPDVRLLGAITCASFALIVAKRRSELVTSDSAIKQRPALQGYSVAVLDAAGLVAATSSVVLYIGFLAPLSHSPAQTIVMAGIILVILAGLLRLLQVIMLGGDRAENPSRMLKTDTSLRTLAVSWAALSLAEVVLRNGSLA